MWLEQEFLGNPPETCDDLNTLHHRSKDAGQVVDAEYFLIVGDESSLLPNLPINETFPHLLSKMMNLEYYNLSIVNGGTDLIQHNLYTWLAKYPLPKFIIISCRDLNNFTVPFNSVLEYDLKKYGIKSGFCAGRTKLLDRSISNLVRAPVIQLIFEEASPKLESASSMMIKTRNQTSIASLIQSSIA